MCADNGEITNNNAESMNHATTVQARAEPLYAMCLSLLEQEARALREQTLEAATWVQAHVEVVEHANTTHRLQVLEAQQYNVRTGTR